MSSMLLDGNYEMFTTKSKKALKPIVCGVHVDIIGSKQASSESVSSFEVIKRLSYRFHVLEGNQLK